MISTGLGIVICVAATMGIVGGNDLPALLSEAWLPTATEAQRYSYVYVFQFDLIFPLCGKWHGEV